mgnify:FL=1
MKKIKCIKCGIRFNDRNDKDEKNLVNRELCWNCNFIWKSIGIMLNCFPGKINRRVAIHLDGVNIKKI